jgi:uncharacterized LabA/DUF88 family protein
MGECNEKCYHGAMRRKSKKRQVYAFIDSQNLNVSVQRDGWKMDWKKFRQYLADEFRVTQAYMFIGYMPEHENLYEQMHHAGYMVVLKPTFDMTRVRQADTKQYIVGAGEHVKKSQEEERHIKGNVDADLVLWAMKEISNYNQAIIVSGDGDYYSLVEYLEEQKKLLKVLAPGGHYSSLFNRFDKYIVRLDHHKQELAYYDRKKVHRRPTHESGKPHNEKATKEEK